LFRVAILPTRRRLDIVIQCGECEAAANSGKP
jgi:hypothetical protein